MIRNQTGHDFSHYKRNTIRRRIARRLAVHQIEDLDHYIKLLQDSPDEAAILAREMLITVTNFFRDREAWESLREQVIHPLVADRPPDVPLRIWVAGCATGRRGLHRRHPLPRADGQRREASPPADLRDRSR